jgi:RNA polymerase sigma-70 factor (ECF subfamily)
LRNHVEATVFDSRYQPRFWETAEKSEGCTFALPKKGAAMTDGHELMRRIAGGDFVAFEELYDGQHRLVYGIAVRMLESSTLAEDLTQEIFTKIWSDPLAFRGGNLVGWIARMTRNRAIDVMRSRAIRLEGEFPETHRFEQLTDEEAFARLESAAVRRAVDSLPEAQRTLIIMGFFGGLTHEQIAQKTGVPLGTVKTRIRSGLQKMRSSLSETVSA